MGAAWGMTAMEISGSTVYCEKVEVPIKWYSVCAKQKCG